MYRDLKMCSVIPYVHPLCGSIQVCCSFVIPYVHPLCDSIGMLEFCHSLCNPLCGSIGMSYITKVLVYRGLVFVIDNLLYPEDTCYGDGLVGYHMYPQATLMEI